MTRRLWLSPAELGHATRAGGLCAVVQVTPYDLGVALQDRGDLPAAIEHYKEELLAVKVVQQDGLQTQRCAHARAQLGDQFLDLLPALGRVLGFEGEPGPIREELPEHFGAITVGDQRERLLESREGKIPLAPEPREAADVGGDVLCCQLHPPPATARTAGTPVRGPNASAREYATIEGPFAPCRRRAGPPRPQPPPPRHRGNRPGRAVHP